MPDLQHAPTSESIARVLLIAAHPDDETLTSGGLLAWLAARADITVLTCTRGERGEAIGNLAPLVADRTAFGDHRAGELYGALTALGVSGHVFLDALDPLTQGGRISDSGMRWDADAPNVRALPALDAGADAFSVAPLDGAVTATAALIDRLKPDLLVVDEPGGSYGHPDHVRAHHLAMAAADAAQHRVPFLAWPVRPETAARAADQWLRARTDLPTQTPTGAPLQVPGADAPARSLVIPDEQVDVAIDVAEVLPSVRDAMIAHRSQVQAATLVPDVGAAAGWYALSNDVLQPIMPWAWLRAAPGWGAPAGLAAALAAISDGRPERSPRWYRPTMAAFGAVLGVALGAVGTAFHRWEAPWGLVLALLAIVVGGVLLRAFVDRLGVLVHGAAAALTVLAMTYIRPGDDVIVTSQPIGVAWVLSSVVLALVVPALAPSALFRER